MSSSLGAGNTTTDITYQRNIDGINWTELADIFLRAGVGTPHSDDLQRAYRKCTSQTQEAIEVWKVLTASNSVLALTAALSKLALIFMDLDNWMFIGVLFSFLGMIPVSGTVLQNKQGLFL